MLFNAKALPVFLACFSQAYGQGKSWGNPFLIILFSKTISLFGCTKKPIITGIIKILHIQRRPGSLIQSWRISSPNYPWLRRDWRRRRGRILRWKILSRNTNLRLENWTCTWRTLINFPKNPKENVIFWNRNYYFRETVQQDIIKEERRDNPKGNKEMWESRE